MFERTMIHSVYSPYSIYLRMVVWGLLGPGLWIAEISAITDQADVALKHVHLILTAGKSWKYRQITK